MGSKYLIDTNAIIEFLANDLPIESCAKIQRIMEDGGSYLSVINQIELLGFDAPDEEYSVLNDFIHSSKLLPLTDAIARKTITIRRQHRIKLPDAIIASTALEHNLILITRNIRDSTNIVELRYLDSHSIDNTLE